MKMLSLMLEEALIEQCKRNGWHYREIFIAGMEAKKGMPAISARINELEEGNKKLQGKLSQFWQQMAALTEKGG